MVQVIGLRSNLDGKHPTEAASAYPKAKNGDGFTAKDRGAVDVDMKLLEGIEPKYILNLDGKPFFDYYLYSDLRPGTIDSSVMFIRLKKGETEPKQFFPKITDNPGLASSARREQISFFRTSCSVV